MKMKRTILAISVILITLSTFGQGFQMPIKHHWGRIYPAKNVNIEEISRKDIAGNTVILKSDTIYTKDSTLYFGTKGSISLLYVKDNGDYGLGQTPAFGYGLTWIIRDGYALNAALYTSASYEDDDQYLYIPVQFAIGMNNFAFAIGKDLMFPTGSNKFTSNWVYGIQFSVDLW